MSTSRFPPETPHKTNMGVEIAPNTRRQNSPTKGETKSEKELPDPEGLGKLGEEIQVPSPNPHNVLGDGRVNGPGGFHSVDQQTGPQGPPSNGPAQLVEDDNQFMDKDSDHNSTADVPKMDWTEFEQRYENAMIDANKVEDDLVLEFEKLSKAFFYWAEASAQRDNDRAWKRLKTRERYVQLSEQRLEQKKMHYVEVVQAFQKALALLSR